MGFAPWTRCNLCGLRHGQDADAAGMGACSCGSDGRQRPDPDASRGRAADGPRSRAVWHRGARVAGRHGSRGNHNRQLPELAQVQGQRLRRRRLGRVQHPQGVQRQDEADACRDVCTNAFPPRLHRHASAQRSHRTWQSCGVSWRSGRLANAGAFLYQRHVELWQLSAERPRRARLLGMGRKLGGLHRQAIRPTAAQRHSAR